MIRLALQFGIGKYTSNLVKMIWLRIWLCLSLTRLLIAYLNCLRWHFPRVRHNEARKMTQDLDLYYEKIDVYINDCMLFWKNMLMRTIVLFVVHLHANQLEAK